MATVRREFTVAASPDAVWAALADTQAVHTRLAQGFVTATEPAPGGRFVTFADGRRAFEALVTVDPAARRLAYSVQQSPNFSHHNASFEVRPQGSGSRVVWTADFLPDAMAPVLAGRMELGCDAMARTLDGQSCCE